MYMNTVHVSLGEVTNRTCTLYMYITVDLIVHVHVYTTVLSVLYSIA